MSSNSKRIVEEDFDGLETALGRLEICFAFLGMCVGFVGAKIFWKHNLLGAFLFFDIFLLLIWLGKIVSNAVLTAAADDGDVAKRTEKIPFLSPIVFGTFAGVQVISQLPFSLSLFRWLLLAVSAVVPFCRRGCCKQHSRANALRTNQTDIFFRKKVNIGMKCIS